MNIEIINLVLFFRDYEYNVASIQDIDGNYYDMITDKNVFCFDIATTTINGVKFNSVEDINVYLFG